LAAEHGIDLARIVGHGTDGAVTEDDVRAALAAAGAAGQAIGVSAPPAVAALEPARREKLTRIQQVGARNLVASWQNVPQFVQMVRVDMSRALTARSALNVVGGNLSTSEPKDKLKRLIEAAERGCHIRALVRTDVPVTLNVVQV
jgi:pyruvate/2-oxoglutarate dehydrogenase complex dihydrolipoamide acyltransferase (E2) component